MKLLDKELKIPRLVVAGATSGVGKTSITSAIIYGIKKRGYSIQAFKVGPDYIDPSYLSAISGNDTRNLDVWLMGENELAKSLAPEFELITAGNGFVGFLDDKSPREEHVKAANDTLAISKEKIMSGKFNVVILDEINYAVQLELLKIDDVIDLIKSKPPELDLVLTGNHAAKEVIDIADLVTEMKEIKHPFKSGIKAKKGIDF